MVDRKTFFEKLRVIKDHPDLEKITIDSYVALEDKIWRENLNSSPHGRPWFTSFHASAFPDGDKPCARLALYTMLDIPNPDPAPPFLVATADIGKQVEYQIVYRWGQSGITIGGSVPLWDGAHMAQVKFEDEETWLTGSSDAILDLRPSLNSVVPVDVKSKKHEIIEEMLDGRRSYEPKHYLQVQAYMYLCNLHHNNMGWSEMGLLPAKSAYILYASRQDPTHCAAFYIPIDNELIEHGVAQLKEWRENFKDGVLPERDKSWRWTEEPCKRCKMKKYACKPDNKDKVIELKNSSAITFAESLRENYNYEEIKSEVEKAWDR